MRSRRNIAMIAGTSVTGIRVVTLSIPKSFRRWGKHVAVSPILRLGENRSQFPADHVTFGFADQYPYAG